MWAGSAKKQFHSSKGTLVSLEKIINFVIQST